MGVVLNKRMSVRVRSLPLVRKDSLQDGVYTRDRTNATLPPRTTEEQVYRVVKKRHVNVITSEQYSGLNYISANDCVICLTQATQS